METEKSHHVRSASWRPRRANGVSSSPGLNLNAGEDRQAGSEAVRQKERIPPSSTFLLHSGLGGLDGARPHQEGHSAFPRLPIQMLISPRNARMDAYRMMFDQIFGHPVAQ